MRTISLTYLMRHDTIRTQIRSTRGTPSHRRPIAIISALTHGTTGIETVLQHSEIIDPGVGVGRHGRSAAYVAVGAQTERVE